MGFWKIYLHVIVVFSLFSYSLEQLESSNAVSFYIANMELSQWSTVDETFRNILAEQTEIFCDHNLEECNINANVSSSLSLTEENVLYFTGFPVASGNNLRVVLGVSIPSEQAISLPAFIPQTQLLNIVLINQYSLQTAIGGQMGLLELYVEEPYPSSTPTSVPSLTLDTAIDNAILIIVNQASLTQWEDEGLEQLFREAVAMVGNDHCTSTPSSCNIHEDSINNRRKKRSEDVIFDETSTYIIPGYPQRLSDSQIEIAFAVIVPFSVTLTSDTVDYFIPQSTLLTLGLELSPVLAELSRAYIIGISAYQPTTQQRSPSLWSQIGAAVTISSILIIFIILSVSIGLPVFWLKKKHREEVYDVNNYVGGVSKQVEILRYRQLRGVHSPVESDEEERYLALLNEEFSSTGSHDNYDFVMQRYLTQESFVSEESEIERETEFYQNPNATQ